MHQSSFRNLRLQFKLPQPDVSDNRDAPHAYPRKEAASVNEACRAYRERMDGLMVNVLTLIEPRATLVGYAHLRVASS